MAILTTWRGRRVDIMAPRPEDIDIADIARGLATTNRWRGQTITPYSVAQHSVEVSNRVSADAALLGLLHDAAEYLTGDLPSPLKAEVCPGWDALEERLLDAIFKAFGIPSLFSEPHMRAKLFWQWHSVFVADHRCRSTEARDLMGDPDGTRTGCDIRTFPPYEEVIEPVDWRTAETAFLWRFAELRDGQHGDGNGNGFTTKGTKDTKKGHDDNV